MDNIIIGSLVSFVISFYAIPVIIQVADMKKLYDIPDERKVHKTPIPSLGGLGIFIGFILGLLFSMNIADISGEFQYYMAAFLVVFFFGIKDDILVLLPMKKFLGQVIVAGILMFKGGLLIDNMHGFLGITVLNPPISYLLTGITIIVVMNAYNLIDGVDGLAGTVGIISTSAFALFFYLNGDLFYSQLGFTFCAAIAAFLIYNYSPARIFMGDTGSMMIGAINAILVIHFIATAANSKIVPISAPPAIGFGILLLPLLDTLRVFAIRIMNGRSPFWPDRNHLHHLLLDKGLSHKAITLTLASFSVLFIAISYFLQPIGITGTIFTQIGLFFIGIGILNFDKFRKRTTTKLAVVASETNSQQFNDEIDNGFARRFRNIVTFVNKRNANAEEIEVNEEDFNLNN